ncbi:hypothetical protein [Legionella hackeliae]|uniref:Uncharacterized protein n=1 Tax=Legionella hackeliae TaxID=449 RepID=A0A0A8UK46_LEGHA|nr:hypothetical protein [Legionella hackeliae]KTD12920.1 hypothetical protein Lhac_1791 [Legionella hackeliae]CEK09230.1 protein of unknown function [Legionella hackeliae]STX49136.1 Uncharacterised protein [Legionella hackeliae]
MHRAFGYVTSFFKTTPVPASVQIDSSAAFDYRKPEHIEIIKNRLVRFKQAQAALHSLDNQILGSLAISAASWAGGVLPLPLPFWTLSLASGSYGWYLLGGRAKSELVTSYRKALTDLIEAYSWSMGSKTNTWYKIGVPSIQEMILTLGPWVKKETIVIWEDSDLAGATLASRALEPTKDFKAKLKEFEKGEQTQSIWFSVYGEGGNDNLIPAANAYLKELAVGAVQKCVPRVVEAYQKMKVS